MSPSKSDPLKALSDPLRISLFELIKDGPKTTPELAEILDENRINLYHHLDTLERNGLVRSNYNSRREKEYHAEDPEGKIMHQEQVTVINRSSEVVSSKHSTSTFILSPPGDQEKYEEFKMHIKKAAETIGLEFDKKIEILQVQLSIQDPQVFEQNQSKVASVKEKRSS